MTNEVAHSFYKSNWKELNKAQIARKLVNELLLCVPFPKRSDEQNEDFERAVDVAH